MYLSRIFHVYLKTFFLFQFVLFFGLISYGQELPDKILPSPSMQQFQKYGDYPVGNFTGIPGIDIPLFTISEGDLELPISLSYHASGARPYDTNGFVGHGWSLNCGGNISRTIVDKGDEIFTPPTPFYTVDELNNLDRESREQILRSWSNYNDSEPDVFSYNFNNHHGKFVLKRDASRTALLMPYKPLKIRYQTKPVKNTILYFNIEDENAFKYQFEESEAPTIDGPSSACPTGWVLNNMTSAIDPSNYITFTHASGPIERSFKRVDMFVIDDDLSFPYLYRSCFGERNLMDFLDYYYPSNTRSDYDVNFSQKVISEVKFRSGRILFQTNLDKMLSKIEIYDINNALIKSMVFEYVNKPAYRKLLKKIKNFDGNNNYLNEYSFNYFNEATGNLPDSETGSTDYWGYYNGAGMSANTGLMPAWDIFYAGSNHYMGSNNRQTDEYFMKTFVLDQINYPTGGHTLFEYEANKYQGGQILNYSGQDVGGLRIKKISNYSLNKPLPEVRTFKYAYDGCYECGYGLMDVIPGLREDYSYSQRGILPDYNTVGSNDSWSTFRRRYFSSESFKDLSPLGSPVIYPKVYEYIGDGEQNTGKIEYSYSYEFPDYQIYNTNEETENGGTPILYKTYVKPFKKWASGNLLAKLYYKFSNSTFKLIKSESSVYESKIEESLRGFHKDRYIFYISDGCSSGPSQSNPDAYVHDLAQSQIKSLYNYGDYNFESGRVHLKEIGNSFYDEAENVSISNRWVYNYDNGIHNMVTSKVHLRSSGDSVITTLKYPHDFIGQQPYTDMVHIKHLWSPVVEQTDYKNSINSTPLTNTRTNYSYWNNDSNQIYPESIWSSFNGLAPEPKIEFQRYDKKGNLSSVSKSGEMKVCYIYSYGGVYPIAKIENSEYNTVESLLGGLTAVDDFRDIPTPTNNQINVFLAPLRANLSGAMITTYTYAPLIGMTSTTDSKGMTTYYGYDNFQRLKHIKDQNGNIVKSYDYHYKP